MLPYHLIEKNTRDICKTKSQIDYSIAVEFTRDEEGIRSSSPPPVSTTDNTPRPRRTQHSQQVLPLLKPHGLVFPNIAANQQKALEREMETAREH